MKKPHPILIIAVVVGLLLGFFIPWQLTLLGFLPGYAVWNLVVTRNKPNTSKHYIIFSVIMGFWFVSVYLINRG
jgi:hypothetical protein